MDETSGTSRRRRSIRHNLFLIFWAAFFMALCGLKSAQASDDLDALITQTGQFYEKQEYEKAFATAEQALSYAEEHYGKSHPRLIAPLNMLAYFSQMRQQTPAAEQFMTRARAICETAYGAEKSRNEPNARCPR